MQSTLEAEPLAGATDIRFDSAVLGAVKTHDDAEEVVKALEHAGFDMKKLSVIGKGYHSEEHPVGFYTVGDRIKGWGGLGAFWGGLWGLLLGAAFVWVPGLGPLAVAGPLTQLVVTALEGAALGGGIGVVGGALSGLGLSKESIIKYESHLEASNYLVVAHGTQGEVDRARAILKDWAMDEPEVVTSDGSEPA